ncbi:LPS O-antigen chain length determinant protein WzzB [Pseudomonas sp. NA-150]|uniref:LPS O-antigen chain length determinant protein WzzB n=1 Tax=Pseudomonas sp. NA-150 TaxID=3367525 RepID=UPI0037CBAE35
MSPNSHTQMIAQSNEVDLFELMRSIWAQKAIIVLVTVFSILIAAAYAFLSKPVYEVKAYVLPPTINGIAEFNYGRTMHAELVPYTVKDVYEVFIRNLQAESLRRTFFTDIYLPSLTEAQRQGSQDALYAEFSKQLAVGLPTADSPNRYAISLQGNDPANATLWLKSFVDRANAAALKEMIGNVMSESDVRARNIEQQISILRENGKHAREDSIAQLQEALSVAESIGLVNPPIISGNLSSKTTNVSANMDGPLTYMRGSEALKAEIKNLEERVSDDPFIPKLRKLEVEQSYFRSINVNPDAVSVYRQDGPIELPDSPIKPKKAFIIVLGLLVGLVLGAMLALIRHIVSSQLGSVRPQLSNSL